MKKPVIIHYTAREVALMVKIAALPSLSDFAKQVGISVRSVQAIADQKLAPPASVLQFLELEHKGDCYSWSISG